MYEIGAFLGGQNLWTDGCKVLEKQVYCISSSWLIYAIFPSQPHPHKTTSVSQIPAMSSQWQQLFLQKVENRSWHLVQCVTSVTESCLCHQSVIIDKFRRDRKMVRHEPSL